MIISTDFDGTIVQHAYPEIGEPLANAFEVLKELKAHGHKLILWTCREDTIKRSYLYEAVKFCKENGLEFDAVNETILEEDFRQDDGFRRKPYAHYYIDDAIVGGFTDWETIRKVLLFDHIIQSTAIPWVPFEKISYIKNHKIGETWKACDRRKAAGWFEKYAPEDKPGIDIGCQYDALNETFRRFDIVFGDGDAEEMKGIADELYHTVYCSHILEHINNPLKALQNWYRILKPGGHLIVCVPHRDLYEKRKTLPSNWNVEHKWFWLPETSEEPCTISLKDLVKRAIPDANIVSLEVHDNGYDYSLSPGEHPVGEFSIEIIVKK